MYCSKWYRTVSLVMALLHRIEFFWAQRPHVCIFGITSDVLVLLVVRRCDTNHGRVPNTWDISIHNNVFYRNSYSSLKSTVPL